MTDEYAVCVRHPGPGTSMMMTDEDGVCVRHPGPGTSMMMTDEVCVCVMHRHVKLLRTCEVITVHAGIMCEIVFQIRVEFYYRLSLILEQKYRYTNK